jgi:hypothetical protein
VAVSSHGDRARYRHRERHAREQASVRRHEGAATVARALAVKDEKTRPSNAKPDPAEERAVRMEEKLDRIIESLGRHMSLRQEDRDAIAALQTRVAALEAIPPPRRRRAPRRVTHA